MQLAAVLQLSPCKVSTVLLILFGVLHPAIAGGHEAAENETESRYHVASFQWSHVQAPFTITLWILLASAAKMGFQMHKKLVSIFPDSSLLIVLGLAVGLVLYLVRLDEKAFHLNSDVFFLFLLPPIVFEAGYFMPNRAFFDNLGTILVYAVIGTIWNSVTIGLSLYAVSLTGLFKISPPLLHSMLFASLISAVDPIAVLVVFEEIHVNQILYISVFGESLLNDAVSVVLYNIFSSFSMIGQNNIIVLDVVAGLVSFFVVGLGGVLIGLIWSSIVSFTTKWTSHVPILEPLFVFTMAYCAYLTAEMFHLSGILAIVFCGIAMKQYVERNISESSQTTVKYFLKMLSSSCETVIFMFLGLSTVSTRHQWDTAFVALTIFFCLVYRTIGVVVQTFVVNKFRVTKLNTVDQFIMAYGGLRGAIAYGLVVALDEKLIPAKEIFVTSTIVMIYFTVFLQGMTIKPLVNFLKVKRQEQRETTMHEKMTENILDHVCSGIEDICGLTGHHSIRDKYEYYNTKYLKPLFMRDAPKSMNTEIIELFKKINLKEAMDHWAEHGNFDMITSASSLSALIRTYAETHPDVSTATGAVEEKPIIDINIFDLEQGALTEHDTGHHKLAFDKRPIRQIPDKPVKKLRRLIRKRSSEESSHAMEIRPPKPIISTQKSQSRHQKARIHFEDDETQEDFSAGLSATEKSLPWKRTDATDEEPTADIKHINYSHDDLVEASRFAENGQNDSDPFSTPPVLNATFQLGALGEQSDVVQSRKNV